MTIGALIGSGQDYDPYRVGLGAGCFPWVFGPTATDDEPFRLWG